MLMTILRQMKRHSMIARSAYGVSKRRTGASLTDLDTLFKPADGLLSCFLDVAVRVYRMRSASVLVVNMRGLATEVCKNIVLAGIGQLTILDDADVTEEDLGCGFFLREEDVGQKVSMQCFIHTIE